MASKVSKNNPEAKTTKMKEVEASKSLELLQVKANSKGFNLARLGKYFVLNTPHRTLTFAKDSFGGTSYVEAYLNKVV